MCTKCKNKISGVDNIEEDIKLIVGSAGGYVATSYIDEMLTYDEDGIKKEGMLAQNDNLRNGLYVLAGGAAVYFSEDEQLVKGLGTGLITYGLKKIVDTVKGGAISGYNRNTNRQYISTPQQPIQRAMPTIDFTALQAANSGKEKIPLDVPQKQAVKTQMRPVI